VPLGLLPDVTYDRLVIKPQPGDLVVLYSDGVSEANESGWRGTRSRWSDEYGARA
jgi:serine phosphatase RsbU (regulator of sigma subunit)